MPKMKTHSGSKKRFRITGRGRVRAQHAFTSHKFEKKNSKRMRRLNKPAMLGKSDEMRLRRLLPYSF